MINSSTTQFRKPVILWSGGLDSTHLLLSTLQETDVYTLYIDCGQAKYKKEIELKNRKKIKRILNKISPHKIIDDYYIEVPNFKRENVALCQPVSWLIGATLVLDDTLHESLNIAYVMGDDALQFLSEIEQTWINLQKITRVNRPTVSILFPYRYIHKILLYEDFLYNHKQVLDLIWTCEQPIKKNKKYTECGVCHPCITKHNLLYEYDVRHNLNENE